MISRGDFFGGVTAAVVALPLALAFGVASGAGAAAGLVVARVIAPASERCGAEGRQRRRSAGLISPPARCAAAAAGRHPA